MKYNRELKEDANMKVHSYQTQAPPVSYSAFLSLNLLQYIANALFVLKKVLLSSHHICSIVIPCSCVHVALGICSFTVVISIGTFFVLMLVCWLFITLRCIRVEVYLSTVSFRLLLINLYFNPVVIVSHVPFKTTVAILLVKSLE